MDATSNTKAQINKCYVFGLALVVSLGGMIYGLLPFLILRLHNDRAEFLLSSDGED